MIGAALAALLAAADPQSATQPSVPRAVGAKTRAADEGSNAKGSLSRHADRAPLPAQSKKRGAHQIGEAPAAKMSVTDTARSEAGAVPERKATHGSAVGTEAAPGGAETQGTAGKGKQRGGTGTQTGPQPKK